MFFYLSPPKLFQISFYLCCVPVVWHCLKRIFSLSHTSFDMYSFCYLSNLVTLPRFRHFRWFADPRNSKQTWFSVDFWTCQAHTLFAREFSQNEGDAFLCGFDASRPSLSLVQWAIRLLQDFFSPIIHLKYLYISSSVVSNSLVFALLICFLNFSAEASLLF